MDGKLVLVSGRADKNEILLQLPMIVGRQRDADLVIVHKSVSRHHCELFERDGLLIVRDNQSSNGTFVNERQVTEAAVNPGDRLTVGPLTFIAKYHNYNLGPLEASTDESGIEPPPLEMALGEDSGPIEFPVAEAVEAEDERLDLSAWGLKDETGETADKGESAGDDTFAWSGGPTSDVVQIGDVSDLDVNEWDFDKAPVAAAAPAEGAAGDMEGWGLASEEDEKPKKKGGKAKAEPTKVEKPKPEKPKAEAPKAEKAAEPAKPAKKPAPATVFAKPMKPPEKPGKAPAKAAPTMFEPKAKAPAAPASPESNPDLAPEDSWAPAPEPPAAPSSGDLAETLFFTPGSPKAMSAPSGEGAGEPFAQSLLPPAADGGGLWPDEPAPSVPMAAVPAESDLLPAPAEGGWDFTAPLPPAMDKGDLGLTPADIQAAAAAPGDWSTEADEDAPAPPGKDTVDFGQWMAGQAAEEAPAGWLPEPSGDEEPVPPVEDSGGPIELTAEDLAGDSAIQRPPLDEAPAKPLAKPPTAAKPAAPPAAKPVAPPAAKPVAPPAAKAVPAAKPVAPPAAVPAAKPVAPPAAKPVAPPMASPAPAGEAGGGEGFGDWLADQKAGQVSEVPAFGAPQELSLEDVADGSGEQQFPFFTPTTDKKSDDDEIDPAQFNFEKW